MNKKTRSRIGIIILLPVIITVAFLGYILDAYGKRKEQSHD